MNMDRKYLFAAVPLLLILQGCDRFGEQAHTFANSAYFSVSAHSSEQPAAFSRRTDSLARSFQILLSYPEDGDVRVTVAADPALTERYNAAHGTGFEPLPPQYLDFEPVTRTIPAGRTYSDPIEFRLKGLCGEGGTGGLEIDRTYLLPLRLTASGVATMAGADVAYYLLRRTSAITMAAQLTDNWIEFPLLDAPGPLADAYNGLTAVTYEALIYIDKFDLRNGFGDCAISTVMGVEQHCLLRIGDTRFERQQLQFDGSGVDFGKFPKSDPAKKLYEGQWYHVAATYDQETRLTRIYVNGRLQSEGKEMGSPAGSGVFVNLAMRGAGSPEAYRFLIGNSYNDFRPLQGKIAEARVWKTARTPEEIWKCMYRLDREPSELPDLLGYWKFDEGEGSRAGDSSRYRNDGVSHRPLRWAAVEVPEINKEN